MNPEYRSRWGVVSGNSDIILAAIVAVLLALLVLPLTDFLIDLLIFISFIVSLTTFLVTLYSQSTLSFSSFPSFLLFLTLFRLCLNIATTRMILTEAHAGSIINTFGHVVTGGSPLAGFLIFCLITGVNFAVITKGAGRVAEVAARFMLDALPGKQLAIDADVHAGLLNEEEAKRRRDEVMQEADFYASMDGASKFVRGDAMAGLLIIFVNLLGGGIIGLWSKGMGWDEMVAVYFTLTIGDGLVTQIPALLVSVAAGILITRSSSKDNLAETFRKQLFNNPRVLNMTAAILLPLGILPGMPFWIIIPLAGGLFFYAYRLSGNMEPSAETLEAARSQAGGKKHSVEDPQLLVVDPLELELGPSLGDFATDKYHPNLFEKISQVRRQIAHELGLVVPSIRVRDNLSLEGSEYVLSIKGVEVAKGSLDLLDPEEPLTADPISLLTSHLLEILREHAAELLNRQEVYKLVENAKEDAFAVINELIPAKLSIGGLLRVLQNLLREKISIRDMVTILEILADTVDQTRDPDLLTEYVRQGMSRSVVRPYLSSDKRLKVITLDPNVEQMLLESLQSTEYNKHIILHPAVYENLLFQIDANVQKMLERGIHPVCLVNTKLRPYLSRLLEVGIPSLAVLSFQEIPGEIQVSPMEEISMDVFMHER